MSNPTPCQRISATALQRELLKPISQIQRGGQADRDTLSHYLTSMCQASGLRVGVHHFSDFRICPFGQSRARRLTTAELISVYERVAAGHPSKIFAAILGQANIVLEE